MDIITNTPQLIISIVLSLLNGIILCSVGYKFLQIIQLTGYRLGGFFSWLKDTKLKYLTRLIFLCLLNAASALTINFLVAGFNGSEYFYYLGLIPYFIFNYNFAVRMFMVDNKTPMKYTTRMNRLLGLLFIVAVGSSFGALMLGSMIDYVSWAILSISPLALLIMVPLAHYLLAPNEALVKLHYIMKAKNKLKNQSKLIKVGITGSFGKTSTKFVLEAMLKQKFKVCTSPASFNTLMGLTKVINNILKPDDEVLICEMGARYRWDIKKLAYFVKPNISILTAVAPQHMKTLKTIDNVAATKYELILNMDKSGFAVFNEGSVEMDYLYNRTKDVEKYRTGFDENSFVYASDVKITKNGTEFKLNINQGGTVLSEKMQSRLLGKHSIENICASAAVAIRLKVSLKEIKKAVADLEPIPHRLELKETENGVVIIDDSYNSNIVSSKKALDVLLEMEGKNKIVLTPGLVEGGKGQYAMNVEFGKNISKVASKVIVVNATNRKALLEGLTINNFDKQNIFIADNLDHAKKIMAEELEAGDILLIENDLPDNFA